MASKVLCLVLLAVVCATNAAISKTQDLKPSTLEIKPQMQQEVITAKAGIAPRRNTAYAAKYQMNTEILRTGLERLQYLLDYNTGNKELLVEMNATFQKHADYTWHLVLEHSAAGDIPDQYAYFRFDRNTTELFVGGYRKC